MKAALIALSLALPGLAHNTVHIENGSAKAWRLEPVPLGGAEGLTTAGLIVSILDPATARYVPLKPGAGGRYTLPGKSRIALDTEAPLADEGHPAGAHYYFRLVDEAGRSDAGSILSYTVSWFFACRKHAPCQLGRAVQLGSHGAVLKKFLKETSSMEVCITAEGWPDA